MSPLSELKEHHLSFLMGWIVQSVFLVGPNPSESGLNVLLLFTPLQYAVQGFAHSEGSGY